MRVTCIVPAAGEGRRMAQAGAPRKQLRDLAGRPVIAWSVRALLAHPWVREVVVAGPAHDPFELQRAIEAHVPVEGVRIVAGGDTRQESVARALAVVGEDAELVAVHDAVRPFLTYAALDAVLREGASAGAAALAIPASDSLRRAGGQQFAETVDRTDLWRMQTPQVARVELLRQALRAHPELNATDEVQLLLNLGHAVRIVVGNAWNFKITTPSDWELAEATASAFRQRRALRE